MALPILTPEQRAAALAKAAEARTARAAIKAELKSGKVSLADVLKRAEDPIVGKMKVSAVVEALPGVGKVKAAQVLEELGIAPTRRVTGLGERQLPALLERFSS